MPVTQLSYSAPPSHLNTFSSPSLHPLRSKNQAGQRRTGPVPEGGGDAESCFGGSGREAAGPGAAVRGGGAAAGGGGEGRDPGLHVSVFKKR